MRFQQWQQQSPQQQQQQQQRRRQQRQPKVAVNIELMRIMNEWRQFMAFPN